jgi:GTP cyclohydrolase IA
MQNFVKGLLKAIGEDPNREGLKKTPKRVEEMYKFLTKGYKEDPDKVINKALYSEGPQDMIVVRDIDFFSLCEHHMLPFFGKCHIAYIPNKKIVGLSKLARLVEIYSRRLQVQERLTRQVADTIEKHLKPQGVAVVMEAEHLCMKMRGVEKQNSVAVTSAMLGEFHDSEPTRAEFLSLIRLRKS